MASLNLACSGAKTTTGGSGQAFKPGIDFYSDSSGRQGQALALQNYAKTHNVSAVVLMIGANNYGFAAIVERCVTNWGDVAVVVQELLQRRLRHEVALHRGAPGHGDHERQRGVQARRPGDEHRGLQPVAAHDPSQTYWSPLPRASGFRYPETGWTRQAIGRLRHLESLCDWARQTVVTAMNSTVKNGAARSASRTSSRSTRRLCGVSGVGLLETDRELAARARSTAASGSSRSGR